MAKWGLPDYTVIFQDNHKIKNLPNPFPVVLLYVLKVIIFLNGKNGVPKAFNFFLSMKASRLEQKCFSSATKAAEETPTFSTRFMLHWPPQSTY